MTEQTLFVFKFVDDPLSDRNKHLVSIDLIVARNLIAMDNSDCTQVRFNFGDGEVFWGEVTDEEQEIMSQQRYGNS